MHRMTIGSFKHVNEIPFKVSSTIVSTLEVRLIFNAWCTHKGCKDVEQIVHKTPVLRVFLRWIFRWEYKLHFLANGLLTHKRFIHQRISCLACSEFYYTVGCCVKKSAQSLDSYSQMNHVTNKSSDGFCKSSNASDDEQGFVFSRVKNISFL